jgi:2-(1,2-epoxy-1,2-dihydrophenyl)acetyl-CoA isomerase
MLGDKVDATEAERLGMVYKVFPEDLFEAEVQKIAQKLSEMPTMALGFTKKLLNLSTNQSLHEQLKSESELQIASAMTEDYAEGVAAFIEKRKPLFKGN